MAFFTADFSNQTGFFDPAAFGHEVTLIGCGGIGASALPTLATLGIPNITIWDPDMVEPRNLASTILFGPDDVGKSKVEVAQRELLRLGAKTVTIHDELFDPDVHGNALNGIVISGVDSMSARKQIWKAIAWNGLVPLYLDGRIGGEQLQLNIVNPVDPDDVAWYEEHQLFDDANAAPLPCAVRNVVYPSATLGGVMASKLASFSRGEPTGRFTFMHMRTLQVMQY